MRKSFQPKITGITGATRTFAIGLLTSVLIGATGTSNSHAEGGQPSNEGSAGSASGSLDSQETAPATPAKSVQSSSSARKPKGKSPSVREAEGTEAYDRFEANTVIKSRYQLNGEHLEVDPD